jgi:GNAT superfamily N-acetyltransferase
MISAVYVVRPGRARDLAALAEVERSAAVTYFSALGQMPARVDVMNPVVLAASQAAGLLWVAAGRQDGPVGFLAAEVVDGLLFVKEVSVARAHQRAGLGRRLVQAAEDHARTACHPAMALTTDRFIPFNGPLYARLGFVEVPAERATPGLRQRLSDEVAAGFDPARRIVMMKPLAALQVRAASIEQAF